MKKPYLNTRKYPGGRTKYTAFYYTLKGVATSAGTFDDPQEALEAARKEQEKNSLHHSVKTAAEKRKVKIGELWKYYIREHDLQPNTVTDYRKYWERNIADYFRNLYVVELTPEVVREIFRAMRDTEGVTSETRKRCRTVLSSFFSWAIDQGYRTDNPIHGVKIEKNQLRKPIKVLTPTAWNRFYECLPEVTASRLFALFLVSTGVRFCEGISFVEGDLDWETGMLEVAKSTVEIPEKIREEMGLDSRWITRDYTKNRTTRRFKIGSDLMAMLKEHVEQNGIQKGELWFAQRFFVGAETFKIRPRRLTPEEMEEAREGTIVAPNGNVYHHASHGAYGVAGCKCRACLQFKADYSRNKKASKRTSTGQIHRTRNGPMDHLSQSYWGHIFRKARKMLGIDLTPYQLRHTHASWCMERNVPLNIVQARLGHKDIASTNKYTWIVIEESSEAPDAIDVMLGNKEDERVTQSNQMAAVQAMLADMQAKMDRMVPGSTPTPGNETPAPQLEVVQDIMGAVA